MKQMCRNVVEITRKMTEYLAILASFLVDMIGDAIDSGFTNSISVDGIVVFGIICSLHGLCYTLFCYGTYVFRITGSHEKDCFWVTVLVSLFLSIGLIFSADYVHYIWHIDHRLWDSLRSCVYCLAISEVFRGMFVFLVNYCQYTGRMRMCSIGFVMYYAVMFLCDYFAVFVAHSLEFVILGTGFSCLMFDLVMFFATGLYRCKTERSGILWVVQTGAGYFAERVLSRLSMVLRDIAASGMDTRQFAVYVVCRRAFDMGDCVFNSMQALFVSKLRSLGKDAMFFVKCMYRKIRTVSMLCFGVLVFLGVLLVHGVIPLGDVIPYCPLSVPVYASGVYYIMYYSAFSVVNDRKKFMICGVVRLCCTVVLCLAGYVTGTMFFCMLNYFAVIYFVTGFYMRKQLLQRKSVCAIRGNIL